MMRLANFHSWLKDSCYKTISSWPKVVVLIVVIVVIVVIICSEHVNLLTKMVKKMVDNRFAVGRENVKYHFCMQIPLCLQLQ